MKVSYNKLQTYLKDKLPTPEQLAEAFTFHFAEVESIEKTGDDSILDVKILPDRAYAKSYESIAVEVAGILNLKLGTLPADFKRPSRTINVRVDDINRVLGVKISEEEIINILQRLWIGVEKKGGELELSIPRDRGDLIDWRDIPEEIGRIYGYDKIKPNLPEKTSAKPSVDKTFYYSEKIKNVMVEMGFSEVYLYSLVPKGDYEIEKPLAADKNHLRTNLTDGIVKALELNAKNADLLGLDEIKIFEIGKVFTKNGEYTSLSVGIKNLKKKQEKEKEKIKAVRDELLKVIEANATILCSIDDSGGIISLNGKQIGITNNTEGVMELNLDALIETLPDPKSYDDLNFGKAVNIQYKKFSHYPFIVRDIAVFVPESVEAEGVWNAVEKGIAEAGGSDLVARYSLFDTFKKDGKTSFAYRIIFQSHDRTLTDDEVNKVMEKVGEKVKSEGWEVR